MNRVAIMLLAAGESKRMGQPKQLLPYKGQTLIAHTLSQLQNLQSEGIVVVLGAHYEAVYAACQPFSVKTCYNSSFATGMGSSICTGMYSLGIFFPEATHLIIALADQALLTTIHYQQLIARSQDFPEKIIAAHYQGIAGAPMLFPVAYFSQLMSLEGDKGARKIIRSYPENIISVNMEEAGLDWDRPEDLLN